jgi:hypothetical protein
MMDKKEVKHIADKEAKKEVKHHEKKMHHTKHMAAGGKTSMQMLKHGRNMAKVMNQRSTGRGG